MLSGRTRTDLEGLFRLIRRVNPTGRDLPKDREVHLYRQKSALQSLLIRRYGDHLRVSLGDDEGVVSLDHRLGQQNACHAVLAELDEDAASWVRRQLDLASLPDADPPRPFTSDITVESSASPSQNDTATPTTLSELLEVGQAAITEYDFETAERCLTKALEMGGGIDAALPLLGLLVEVLADDEAALGLVPRLSAEAKRDSGIRSLLALAAARQGDRQGAASFMDGGIGDDKKADIHAALAGHALSRGDLEAAGNHVDALRTADAGHPAASTLALELEELAAVQRQPEEERLLQLFEQQGAVAVEEQAREFLHRWQNNDLARRIMREASESRRREEIEAHLAAGDAMVIARRWQEAADHFSRALDAGCDQQGLSTRIAELHQKSKDEDEARRVEDVVAVFDRRETEADRQTSQTALLAYLNLPADLRARVREHAAQREHVLASPCRWLEDMGAPSHGSSRAHQAVLAVLDLAEAGKALRRGHAQRALDLLAPHEKGLREIPDAESCRAQAAAALAHQQQEAMRLELEVATGALADGHLDKARKSLVEIAPTALSTADRKAFETLKADLGRAEQRQSLIHEHRRHLQADDLLGARSAARALASITADAERETWEQCSMQLLKQIHNAWRVEIDSTPQPFAQTVGFTIPFLEYPELWLAEDGRSLFISEARERWLLIQQLDLQSGSVCLKISLQTPEPLGDLCKFSLSERSFSFIGENHFLELNRADGSIERWRSFRELVPENHVIENTFLVPGSSYLWISMRPKSTHRETIHIVDVDSWRANRRLENDLFAPFPGRDQPGVFSYHERGRIYSASGVPNVDLELPQRWQIQALTTGPEDQTWWLTVVRHDLPEDFAKSRVEVVEFNRRAQAQDRYRRLFRLESFEDTGVVMASDPDAGLGFVVYQSSMHEGEPDQRRLAAFSRDRAEPLYDVPIISQATLVQDERARHVALVSSRVGLAVAHLGPHPPAPDFSGGGAPPPSTRNLYALKSPMLGGYLASEVRAAVLSTSAGFAGLTLPKIVARIEGMAQDGLPVDIACLALQRLHPKPADWQTLVQRLARERPDDVGLALMAAASDAESNDWPRVHKWLADKDPETLGTGRRFDFHQLLGFALLYLGRPSEAAREFELGISLQRDDSERLKVQLDFALALTGSSSDDPEDSAVRHLISAIHIGEKALQNDDLEGARAALDQQLVWESVEIQSTARLAELYLRDHSAPIFHRRHALALYIQAYSAHRLLKLNLSMLEAAWQEDRLEDVIARARAWLETVPSSGPGPSTRERSTVSMP